MGQRSFRFEYRVSLDAPEALMNALPESGPLGAKTISIVVGRLSNRELSGPWYESEPWSHFEPGSVSDDRVEQMDLYVEPSSKGRSGR